MLIIRVGDFDCFVVRKSILRHMNECPAEDLFQQLIAVTKEINDRKKDQQHQQEHWKGREASVSSSDGAARKGREEFVSGSDGGGRKASESSSGKGREESVSGSEGGGRKGREESVSGSDGGGRKASVSSSGKGREEAAFSSGREESVSGSEGEGRVQSVPNSEGQVCSEGEGKVQSPSGSEEAAKMEEEEGVLSDVQSAVDKGDVEGKSVPRGNLVTVNSGVAVEDREEGSGSEDSTGGVATGGVASGEGEALEQSDVPARRDDTKHKDGSTVQRETEEIVATRDAVPTHWEGESEEESNGGETELAVKQISEDTEDTSDTSNAGDPTKEDAGDPTKEDTDDTGDPDKENTAPCKMTSEAVCHPCETTLGHTAGSNTPDPHIEDRVDPYIEETVYPYEETSDVCETAAVKANPFEKSTGGSGPLGESPSVGGGRGEVEDWDRELFISTGGDSLWISLENEKELGGALVNVVRHPPLTPEYTSSGKDETEGNVSRDTPEKKESSGDDSGIDSRRVEGEEEWGESPSFPEGSGTPRLPTPPSGKMSSLPTPPSPGMRPRLITPPTTPHPLSLPHNLHLPTLTPSAVQPPRTHFPATPVEKPHPLATPPSSHSPNRSTTPLLTPPTLSASSTPLECRSLSTPSHRFPSGSFPGLASHRPTGVSSTPRKKPIGLGRGLSFARRPRTGEVTTPGNNLLNEPTPVLLN